MKKIKSLFLEIKLFIIQIWDKADELVERIAPIAINVVEQIKQVNESTSGDVIELIISKAIKPEITTVRNGVRIRSNASGIARRRFFSTMLINQTASSTGNTVP